MSLFKNFYVLVFFFLLAVQFNIVNAEITKCVSDGGQVYYSDSGCKDNDTSEIMNIRNQRTGSTPIDHQYSIESQARAMRAKRLSASTSSRSQSQSFQAEQEKQRNLEKIEKQIVDIDKNIADAKKQLQINNSIRRRWATEKLAELKREKESLLRQRENFLGVIVKPAQSEDIERLKMEADQARSEAAFAEMEAHRARSEAAFAEMEALRLRTPRW